jgi:hypothetical protein
MEIGYATREQVKNSLEVNESAHKNDLIDSKILAASRSIEGQLHRRFYPELKTIGFDYPTRDGTPTWAINLGSNELISLASVTAGGTSLSLSDLDLTRADQKVEPPYSTLEIDLSSNAAFQSGATWQRAISITGVYGWGQTDTSYEDSELAAGINSSIKVITVRPRNGILVTGTGGLVHCGTEKMVVIGRQMATSGATITSNVDDLQSVNVIPVSSGALFAVGETIAVDGERMYVYDITGNNLSVWRSYDGTTLAEHTSGAAVYALRSLNVLRGVLGTTAATHSLADVVTMHRYPALINELCVAESVVLLEQQSAGYAREVGSGQSTRESGAGLGLEDLRARAFALYARNTVRAEAV